MKTCASKSLEETQEIAATWLRDLKASRDGATIAALSGHLGAGKTAFVKAIAKEFGITEEVTSPTFVIMKIYDVKDDRWHRLVHIDAYRLEKREELEVLEWERLVSDSSNLIVIEWPENVSLKPNDVQEYLSFEIKEGIHTISSK